MPAVIGVGERARGPVHVRTAPNPVEPEWEFFWRPKRREPTPDRRAGLWVFDAASILSGTIRNLYDPTGSDVGGGHIGAGTSTPVGVSTIGVGMDSGGSPTITSPDDGFWHDGYTERTFFALASTGGGSGEQFVLQEGGGAGGVSMRYGVGGAEWRWNATNGGSTIALAWQQNILRACAMVCVQNGTTFSAYANGRLIGSNTTATQGDHGSDPNFFNWSNPGEAALFILGVHDRAWSAPEAMRWSADPWGPFQIQRAPIGFVTLGDATVVSVAATATAAAQAPIPKIDVPSAAATATGAAQTPTPVVTVVSTAATATAAAQTPIIDTGAGGDATVASTAATATAAAQAPTPAIDVLSAAAAATGAAQTPTPVVAVVSTAATATAAGQPPTITVDDVIASTVAAATAAAQTPTPVVAVVSTAATATGAAQTPTVALDFTVTSVVATATATAYAPDDVGAAGTPRSASFVIATRVSTADTMSTPVAPDAIIATQVDTSGTAKEGDE